MLFHENLNIISVPNGLIGYEIKPNSLFISTSKGEFIEDTHGNLIVSGTNLTDEYYQRPYGYNQERREFNLSIRTKY